MFVEKPVAFGRAGTLVGVLCSPVEPVRGESTPTGSTRGASAANAARPAAIFINAGILHRVGPNRLYVNLARMLARAGIPSLRFDLGGVGDSATARDERGSVLELVERDLRDAVDLAAQQSADGTVVLIGLCSGADNALQTAVRDERVVGAVLLDPNVHRTRAFWMRHYLRRLFRAETWRLLLTARHPTANRIARSIGMAGRAGPAAEEAPFLAPTTLPPIDVMAQQLESLAARGCRLRYVFTGGLPYRYNHEHQFVRTFPGLRTGDALRVTYHRRWDHSFSDPDAQAQLGRAIVEWFEGMPAAGSRRSASAAQAAALPATSY